MKNSWKYNFCLEINSRMLVLHLLGEKNHLLRKKKRFVEIKRSKWFKDMFVVWAFV